MPHVHLSRLAALFRQQSGVRLITRPFHQAVVRSGITLGRMPRPGPQMHSRLIPIREDTPLVGADRDVLLLRR
jgi:hypothetical protein